MIAYKSRREPQETIRLEPGDKILISRTDRLGDLVLALPFVESMKLRYPECRIEVLASLYASPILEENQRIDRIVRVQNDQLLGNKFYAKDLLRKITRDKYKAVVVLFPERAISRLFYRAEIPFRIGTAGRFHSYYFNYRLIHSRRQNLKHEYAYNLDFLQFFRDGQTEHVPRVYSKPHEMENAQRLLREAGVGGAFCVLHPGSGGSAERWPVDRFILLYDELTRRGIEVVISGSESERERTHEIAERMGIAIRQIAGETDLRTLTAVLRLARVVVANSTGPLHLAVAVATTVVGLYPGKRVMSPQRWGPIGTNHRVMLPEGPDCACPAKQCTCMHRITVDAVAGAVSDAMSRP